MSECSHCGFPIRPGERVRSFGTHVAHSSESRCLGYLQAEIERLTLKCTDLEADYLRRHHEYMDYRYGSEGLPEGAEMTIERLCAALERLANERDDLDRKAVHLFARKALGAADEAPPAKDELLEALRAGRVTYPPEVLPTGRWMPAEETMAVKKRCASINPDMGMGRCEKEAGHDRVHQCGLIQWVDVR